MTQHTTCPNCHQPVSPEAQFCLHCGYRLHAQVHPSGSAILSPQPPPSAVQARLTPGELTQPLPDIVKQFDSSATTNINIAGLLAGFYSGAIFAGKVLSTNALYAIIYALPLCFLLATVILAMQVFYPDGYLHDDYLTLIKKKEQRLKLSSTLLQIGVGIVIISVFVYLIRPS